MEFGALFYKRHAIQLARSHEFLNGVWGEHLSTLVAGYKAAFTSVLCCGTSSYCALRSCLLKFSVPSAAGSGFVCCVGKKQPGKNACLYSIPPLPHRCGSSCMAEQQLLLSSFLEAD